MIATLMSYEAERRTIGNLLASNQVEKDERVTYFERRRTPKPQFTFKTLKGEEPKQLSNFTLIYPCVTLANLYDPESNLKENLEPRQLKKKLAKEIRLLLDQLNIRKFGKGGGEIDKWLWAAPILLDKLGDGSREIIKSWFSSTEMSVDFAIAHEGNEKDTSEHLGRYIHFLYVKGFFEDPSPKLPALTEEKYTELINHLVELTLAAPGVCLYRCFSRYFVDLNSNAKTAYNTSLAFLSLFNKPESIAIIRLVIDKKPYWQQVLEYCLDGNFQSMIDEFVYLLYDCENLKEIKKLQQYITDILTLKTSTIDIDSQTSFLKKTKKLSIRTHYAMDFGLQKTVTKHGSNSKVKLRQTFKSPFRPFVLATTSIGQEGLDFHLYCKRIMHWNLPSNPIDFEQREGRINRYKSLVIRQNIGPSYKQDIDQSNEHLLWDKLFDIAKSEKSRAKVACDLIPFWHVEPENGYASKIERYVPLYPFSRDLEKYDNIQHVLTYYRLTFGQPRQDDLIKTFKRLLEKKDFDDLTISLCPLTFTK